MISQIASPEQIAEVDLMQLRIAFAKNMVNLPF